MPVLRFPLRPPLSLPYSESLADEICSFYYLAYQHKSAFNELIYRIQLFYVYPDYAEKKLLAVLFIFLFASQSNVLPHAYKSTTSLANGLFIFEFP